MVATKDPAADQKRPNGFVSVRDILDENQKATAGSFVDIIGVVVDTQAPTTTRGKDWKTTLRLIDKSVDDDGDDESIACHMFMKQEEMPGARCGDVFVLHQVKVQNRHGDISLLTHFTTKFSLFAADKIPPPPGDVSVARVSIAPKRQKQLSKAELGYVSFLQHNINKARLPTVEEYKTMVVQSLTVKEKFKELKDVGEGFCDLIVQIVKDPYDLGDKIALWVSDYTENASFYNFAVAAANSTEFEDGDPYGYVAKFGKNSAKKKPEEGGPYGRRSMQVTCWDPHVSAIREAKISKGTWVLLKNVHVKYGRDVPNLEGYLREDRGAYGVKIGIFALDSTDRESMDPRHLAALKRHRDYERTRKSQLKEIEEAAKAGQKRKSQGMTAEQLSTFNSHQKRKARRQAEREKAAQEALEEQLGAEKPKPVCNVPTPNLNSSVKCENHSVPASKVSEVLERVTVDSEIGGETVNLSLPFVNINHRVDVRVTDFHPSDLKAFAYPKKPSKFDALSDNENSDLEPESDEQTTTESGTVQEWEWRFALQLEDATPEAEPRARFWVVVDNQAAQCLINLDASNLKHDPDNLDALRRRMFYLWGNLEEQKGARNIELVPSRTIRGDQPPPDSSDDEVEEQADKITNRPFSCCVRQYGIKLRENDPSKADAGNSHRWVRMFGLHGTRIAGV